MNTAVSLSYFHHEVGPKVYFSFPKNSLHKDLSVKIANIMDQQYNEGFFTHSVENLESMNYYFEIHSDWARGNKEMLMVSIILDQQISAEIEESISNLCAEFSERLQSSEEIYTAFYINDLNSFDDNDKENIVKNEALIEAWVNNLYWAIVEYTWEKPEPFEVEDEDEDRVEYVFTKIYWYFDKENKFKEIKKKLPLHDHLDSDRIILFVDLYRRRVWIWHGSNTTTRMKYIAAKLSLAIRDRYGSEFKITAVDEGNETLGFKIMIGEEDESESSEVQFRSIYDRSNGNAELIESLLKKLKKFFEEGDISVLKLKFCKYCGSKLTEDQDFCNVCGEKVI